MKMFSTFILCLFLFTVNVILMRSAHRDGWDSGIKCIELANGNQDLIRQCKQ